MRKWTGRGRTTSRLHSFFSLINLHSRYVKIPFKGWQRNNRNLGGGGWEEWGTHRQAIYKLHFYQFFKKKKKKKKKPRLLNIVKTKQKKVQHSTKWIHPKNVADELLRTRQRSTWEQILSRGFRDRWRRMGEVFWWQSCALHSTI